MPPLARSARFSFAAHLLLFYTPRYCVFINNTAPEHMYVSKNDTNNHSQHIVSCVCAVNFNIKIDFQ